MVTCSSLLLPCGYPRALGRSAVKSAKMLAAADKGTIFHGAVELWGHDGQLPAVADDEVLGWLLLLACQWAPPPGAHFEVAVGLSESGQYVPVVEPSPHVYLPAPGQSARLLTAGRADVIWVAEGNIVHVRDWKTGKYPVAQPARNLQLSALALAAAAFLDAEGFVREIYYARDGYLDADLEPVMLDSEEAAEAWNRVETAAKLDESPRPSVEACEPCWERRTRRCSHAIAL